jgi:hypothetical protein
MIAPLGVIRRLEPALAVMSEQVRRAMESDDAPGIALP